MEEKWKCKRSNFTILETETLLACLEKKRHIVENRTTNAVSNKNKTEAWSEITKEFNTMPGVIPCTTSQLQNLYKNIKRKANKRVANTGIEVMKTRGSSRVDSDTGFDERLINVVVVREPLSCDSDAVIEPVKTEVVPDCTSSSSNPISEPETPKVQNSSAAPRPLTGYSLKRKMQLPASVKASEALEEQIKVKTRAIEAENKLVLQKLQEEIKQSKELHEMRLNIEKERLQQSQEEHALKMSVLLSKLNHFEKMIEEN